MKLLRHLILASLPLLPFAVSNGQELHGTPIGAPSVDYSTGLESTTVNGPANAFDGDPSTFYAAYVRTGGWVGLDLGEKHIIKRVGYMSRKDWPQRMTLGIFEGANNPDFSDAVPLYMIKSEPGNNTLNLRNINVSRGFRYVRYIGPDNVRCNVAEVRFYGVKGAGDDSQLYSVTNLPTLTIHTDGAKDITSKEVYSRAIISVISDGGKTIYTDSLGIRGRGNASWGFPKKPYKIKLDHKTHLLGMPAKAKKWTLINNWGDKTLIRNMLAFKISDWVGMDYTPAGQLVDVILNGDYKGTYQLCDQIEVKKHRVGVTEMTPADNAGSALTGGYLVEIDAYAASEPQNFNASAYSLQVTIHSPDADSITTTQHHYISQYFNTMCNRLASNFYNNPTIGFRKYLDEDSFLKYFMVGELSGNTDTYWSTYMYKDRDSTRIYTGPVWDFDLAFENDARTHPISSLSTYLYASDRSSVVGAMRSFVTKVLAVDDDRLKLLWSRARYYGGLTPENVTAFLDSLEDVISESQKLNFMRWPILSTQVHQNYQALGSYEKEMQVVRDYMAWRLPWLDNKIGLLTPVKSPKIDEGDIRAVSGGIEVSGLFARAAVSVYDVSGVCLKRVETSGARTYIPLARGIYVVRAAAAGKTVSKKLVVE